uniref:Zinc finger protein 706 n=1 Tax=Cyanistes caeruleus TaxID=156563 RepID=A0A8C0UJ37_CYACU
MTALCLWLWLLSQIAAVVSLVCRLNVFFLFVDMARGQQKIQSQQKNAKKQAEQKKKQGHDQKAAAKAALIYTCTVCRTQMPDPKTFKQHFESKHPKTPLPPELADVQA